MKRIFSASYCIVIIFLHSGCHSSRLSDASPTYVKAQPPANTSSDCDPNSTGQPAQTPRSTLREIVGIWMRRLPAEETTREGAIGFILEADSGSPVAQQIERGNILAGFRSAREAASMAKDYPQLHWIEAQFTGTGTWTYRDAVPPSHDVVPATEAWNSEIGRPEAGLCNGAYVFLLPPPMQSRGIALVVCVGHGRSMSQYYPLDNSSTIILSWGDLETRTTGKLMSGLMIYSGPHEVCIPWDERAKWRP
jgi:hypothetical protein